MAIRLKKRFPTVRVLYDCRGVDHAEVVYAAGERLGASGFDPAQAEAARQADKVVCVSHPLKELLVEQAGVSADAIEVTPCSVDCDHLCR